MEVLKMDDIIAHCEQRANFFEEYTQGECITSRFSENRKTFFNEYWEQRKTKEYLEELKQYREKEKQGLLVKLPCKVGDTVWATTKDFVSEKIPLRTFPCKVREITIKYGNFLAMILKTNINEETYSIWWTAKAFPVDEVGKTIFLTEQEAEESLKENI